MGPAAFRRGLAGAMAGLAVAAAAACGSGSPSPTPAPTCNGQLSVGALLPLHTDPGLSAAIERGVRLALAQAAGSLDGCSLSLTAVDDGGNAVAAVSSLAGNTRVIGAVGPVELPAALDELPFANRQGFLLVSPTLSDSGLTVSGTDPSITTSALRPTGTVTFFRVVPNDIAQGMAVAEMGFTLLHAQRVAVIEDGSGYAQELGASVVLRYTAAGGSVVDRLTVAPSDSPESALATARGDGAQAIIYVGESPTAAAAVSRRMVADHMTIPLLLTDRTETPAFISAAGSAAATTYATSVAIDPARTSSASQFVTAYTKAYGGAPPPFAAEAYDAAGVLAHALAAVIHNNGGRLPNDLLTMRTALRLSVAAATYSGAVGQIRFDALGDPVESTVTIWRAGSSGWTYDRALAVRPGA